MHESMDSGRASRDIWKAPRDHDLQPSPGVATSPESITKRQGWSDLDRMIDPKANQQNAIRRCSRGCELICAVANMRRRQHAPSPTPHGLLSLGKVVGANGGSAVPFRSGGQEVTLGFNARYFLDALAAIGDDEVVLGLSGELDPAIIKPATESSNSRYLAVIMPMRI